MTHNGIVTERVLSDGEASSGFETVSSINSKFDYDELELSYSVEGEDFFDEIEDEILFQEFHETNRRNRYHKARSCSPTRDRYRRRKFNNFWKRKPRDRCDEDWDFVYDAIGKRQRRKEFEHSRVSNDWDWNKGRECKYWKVKKDFRVNRYANNRNFGRNDEYRSSKNSATNSDLRPKSSNFKEFKMCRRRSGSFDETNSSKSNSERSSSFRKRRRVSYSRSPSSSFRNRFDYRLSPELLKKDQNSKSKNAARTLLQSRKKERTPFLVELERKLKEAEIQKNVTPEIIDLDAVQQNVPEKMDGTMVMPKPSTVSQNPTLERTPSYLPSVPKVPGLDCPLERLPTVSLDNLPLVPGPSGLPVHITMTGERIPYDMDGRRIPIGPNGYYLPLDPTGRLYAHIVSPGNQAVPIHMTEDGVLRLPSSEPVPVGPTHNLPVNIDGSVIPMGPDSKPLYPCSNLPKKPPFHLLPMLNPESGNNDKITQQPDSQYSHPVNQSAEIDSNLLEFIQNSFPKISKKDLLQKYRKNARERNEDVLKCIEIQKNLGVNPSKGGVKRSIPTKLTQKKAFKSGLDCEDSDSTSALKSSLKSKKDGPGGVEEIIFSSDDEQSVLKVNYDKEELNVQIMETEEEDPFIKKIQQAIKSLCERNFKPPALGRFIISKQTAEPVTKTSPNESPLLRDQIKLPFITPNLDNHQVKKTSSETEENKIAFKFLPQKSPKKGDKATGFRFRKMFNTSSKIPVFTFDFAMQCDFTSVIIKNLNSKISELEMEVVRLRNVNANLLDSYKNVQAANEKKGDELKKALIEIQERNNEIVLLKRLIGDKRN